MKLIKKLLRFFLILAALFGALVFYLRIAEYGFHRTVSSEEEALRLKLVSTAEGWFGTAEGSARHKQILEIYNTHEPLAQDYAVTAEDNWCAAFGSTAAIQCSLTGIIPTECSCQRQIALWEEMGCWEEDDNYLPLPGDYIYYDWDFATLGDSTGWADHVGIVAGTHGPFIKVIEGNKNDTVTYRFILRDSPVIRGYGLPDFASAS